MTLLLATSDLVRLICALLLIIFHFFIFLPRWLTLSATLPRQRREGAECARHAAAANQRRVITPTIFAYFHAATIAAAARTGRMYAQRTTTATDPPPREY